MAKQSGIVVFDGTLGGINFYLRKGVPTARRAGGGFNRKAIKTSPTMQRVRESNTEFSRCSQVNKYFKRALFPFLDGYKDGTLHSRLMRLFLGLKDLDGISKRGERRVANGYATFAGKGLVSDFVFTPKRSRLFDCNYGFDWDALRFDVTNFSVGASDFPAGSDYMEVQVGVIRFNFDTNAFTQSFGSAFVVERDFNGDGFSVDVAGLPDGLGELFAVVRVCFYQWVNGRGYLLPGGSGFGLSLFVAEGV